MVYLNQDKFFVKCTNIDNVYITSKQILNTIKNNKFEINFIIINIYNGNE